MGSDPLIKEASLCREIKAPIFLVGCGRSGTTWLQALLAQHPDVATSPETQVFARYLALLDQRWHQECESREKNGVRNGIQDLVSREEFDELLANFARKVLLRVWEKNPSASVVLEKSPGHVNCAELILACFPDARFLHIIRDPRGVFASRRAAAVSWGRHWSTIGPVDGALEWREAILSGQDMARMGCDLLEVKYEELLGSTEQELRRVFAWAGLEVTDDALSEYIESCRIDKLRKGRGSKAEAVSAIAPSVRHDEFYRKGSATGWQKELGVGQVAVIEALNSDLMRWFGYAPTTSLIRIRMSRWRIHARRVVSGLRWRVNRIMASVEGWL